ncbi:monocarboxylate transporter 13-like [Amphiura filiformis]|uniref:monocarboxylate transporter 13-like n=1 Tax=Amphiura filiformis TaxID=82378 RepID=UPI003B21113B
MVFIASLATTKNYFPSNTNHIWGLTSAGGALGMMVLPPICEFLIQIYGWRGALMLLSTLNSHLVVCGLLVNQRRDMTAQEYFEIPVTDESAAQQSRCPNIRNVPAKISRYISFYLIKNPKFIPIIAAHMLTGVVFTGWTIFLVPNAIGKGLPPQTASFLSFCGGLGTLLGRPLMGPIIKNCNITAIQLMVILASVNAVAFGVDVLVNTFWALALLAFVNGFATGLLPNVTFGAATELLGDDRAVEGFSFAWMFFALGDFVAGFISGYLLDQGSGFLFMVLGGFSLLTVLVTLTSNCVPQED